MFQKIFLTRINRIIASRTNFNIFVLIMTSYFSLLTFNLSFAQQTYNLEVIFKKTHEPTTWYEGFGQALSSAGDVNGDGYDDILIGSPSGEVRGRCYLYFGGNPMDTLVDMTFYGDVAGDGFAVSVCSGFLNNDSISDIVVGLCNGWVNGTQPGKVYVYFGGSGLDTIPDGVFSGVNNTEAFGSSVACGDINGDGREDLVVGATYYPNTFVIDGRVYVYYGGPLLDTIPDVVINGHNSEAFGKSVGSGGDVNSDGFEDIVVGADENSEAYPGAGKVYVFLGGNPMDTMPDCWLHGEGPSDWLGWFGCDIMKVQSDYDRMITSTRFWEGNSYGRGKVYILYGGDPMDTLPDVWMVGESDSSALGRRSTSAGNFNTGGFEAALAGAPSDYGFKGTGYNWLGDSPMDSTADAFLRSDYSGLQIGWVVASAGDVNGEGYDEVMVSNYAADSNQTVWVCRYTGQGIQDIRYTMQDERIEIYPNPFVRIFYLRGTGNVKRGTVKIYDVLGKEVIFEKAKSQSAILCGGLKVEMIQIDTRNLPAGVYFVQTEVGDMNVIRKVIKIK